MDDPNDEDEILVRELEKLSEVTAEVTSQAVQAITGVAVPAARLQARGARGTRFAATRLPSDTYQTSIVVALPQASAVRRALDVLQNVGELLPDEAPPEVTEPLEATAPPAAKVTVRGLVKAGYLNMNPAVVTITLTPLDPARTTVHIRGAAKEGLVKQHAGEKAAKRVAERLLNESP